MASWCGLGADWTSWEETNLIDRRKCRKSVHVGKVGDRSNVKEYNGNANAER